MSEVLTMLKKYRVAASRMCDRWAEGDQAVKDELWKGLHGLESEALEIIERAEGRQQRIWFVVDAAGNGERREQQDIHEAHGRQVRECLQQSDGSVAGEIPNTGDIGLPRGIGWGDGAQGWIIEGKGQTLLQSAPKQWDDDFPAPKICCVADGILGRTPILHAFGNAIVPQVAAEFIKAYRGCVE